jgi:hypothetical protein
MVYQEMHHIKIAPKFFGNAPKLKYTYLPQPKIKYPKKLKADSVWRMLAAVRFEVLIFPFRINIKIYKISIILDFISCAALSLTIREEERGLKVFENKVLRRIFRPKREETQRDGNVIR